MLLLNCTLTVRAGEAPSHSGRGWEEITDAIVAALAARERPLWGKRAERKAAGVDARRHLVLRAPHPSPLSAHRGFFGSRPFSQTNTWLKGPGEEPISWA